MYLRKRMVKEQIKARGISNPSVLSAMEKVKRELFVPVYFKYQAYSDNPLPIGNGQTISQPYIVAFMTEALQLKGGESVLEIGTGSGYQAAILAEIVKNVYSVEILCSLAESTQKKLVGLGYKNIKIKCGNGYAGWGEHAPYDAIIVTAAPDHIPNTLTDQLKTGGRMVIPIGDLYQELIRITKTDKGLSTETLIPVRFVPMTGKPD